MKKGDRISLEDVRASLWFTPTVAAAVSLTAALGIAEIAPDDSSALGRLPWPGDHEAARTVLQVIATTIIPVTSLTFSLVVVALQLASQQFSPRLLREFARDRLIQSVLAVLVSTFVFALTILLGLNGEEPVPKLAVLTAFVMGLLSIGALLAFLGHLVRSLRIDTMMAAVHEDASATLEQAYPALEDPEPVRPDGLPEAHEGTPVPTPRSGFVKVVRPERLVEAARQADVLLLMAIRPGDHVVQGTPLATAVRPGGAAVTADEAQGLSGPVLDAVELGYERTSEQDTALGLRQLTDIAVKALSPGINDPVTAVHAIGYLTDLLVRLQTRRLGPQVHADAAGVPRAVLPDRDHRYYLDVACSQIRRYGRREPTVLVALLRMLRDVAVWVHDDEQAEQIRAQVRLVVAEMAADLLPEDTVLVHDVAGRVEQVLCGRIARAYADRSGETRSI